MVHKFNKAIDLSKRFTTTALQTLIFLAKNEDGFIPIPANLGFPFKPSAAGYINSIQSFEITIATNATSNTATISSVTTANSVIFFAGFRTTDIGSTWRLIMPRAELTNSTTVTVYRDTSSVSNTVTVCGTVVEFISSALTSSIQTGTVTIANSATSGTATISSVNTANAAIFYLGHTVSTTTTSPQTAFCRLDLTNGTTVTANRGSSTTAVLTIGYAVVEFASSIIQSIQQRSVTYTSSSTTDADTISSINTANTILVYDGVTSTGSAFTSYQYSLQLTSSTNVNLVRAGTNSTTRTVNYTAVEFKSGVLKSIQRGTTSLSGATSASTTITSVNTSKAVANQLHFSTASTGSSSRFATTKLASATSIQSDRVDDDSNTTTTGWETVEFV